MTTTLPPLQSLLLDLLSPVRPLAQESIDSLTEGDWASLLAMVRQHRLAPLLFWQLKYAKGNLAVPGSFTRELEQSYKQATLRALSLQRELITVVRILEKAGIPCVALKGAFLAFQAYPKAGLRPMRDLDVLVQKGHEAEAYQALLNEGLQRVAHYQGSPDTSAGHHLPPLRSASGRVNIEVHRRLFQPERNGNECFEPSDTLQFWQRLVVRHHGEHSIAFTSPTDLLIHLIVHAVCHHRFNNGPLLLSDLAYLLDTQEIDWPLFWSLADQGGNTRACVLALSLAERYWGSKPIAWPKDDNQDQASLNAYLDTAAGLMLGRDFDARQDVALSCDLLRKSSFGEKFRFLTCKFFPPKADISASFPVSEHSWQVYLWYPAKWWWLLAQRLPEYLRSRRQAHLQSEVRQLEMLEHWLGSDRGGSALHSSTNRVGRQGR